MRKYLLFAAPLMLLGSPESFAQLSLGGLPSAAAMPAQAPAPMPMPRAQSPAPSDGPVSKSFDNGRHHLSLYFDPNSRDGKIRARSDTDNTDLDVDALGRAHQNEVRGWADVETGVKAGPAEDYNEVQHTILAKPPSQ